MDNIRNEIKSYIAQSGWTLKAIVEEINKRNPNKETSISNLSNKLSRGTIRYSEAKEIADIIGLKIEWTEI